MRKFENIGRIKVFINDPNKKGTLKIIKEVFTLMITKKEIPFYYFKYLYRKDVINYLDFLSNGDSNRISENNVLHKPEYRSLLVNKLFFALLTEKSPINTPKRVSHNLGNNFSYNNTIETIHNKEEFINFFETIFIRENIDGLFLRPPTDHGGKGCYKLTTKNIKHQSDSVINSIINGYYVHTRVIEQHQAINEIHSKSLNTMRILTLITAEDVTEIISVYMRFGVGDSVVDNASSGGFFVGVNIEDGTLDETGHYLTQYGGSKIKKHPDSGFVFDGFRVPYFKEACEEVIKGVKVIPDKFIGWDVAISPEGPVIIEANYKPHIQASNIAYGGLLKNPHIKKLMMELK